MAIFRIVFGLVFTAFAPGLKGEEFEGVFPWRPFELAKVQEALDANKVVCIWIGGDVAIGAKSSRPPRLSIQTLKKTADVEIVFAEVNLAVWQKLPSDFIERYLRRIAPSLTVVSDKKVVFTLSGNFKTHDIEQLLQLVQSSREAGDGRE